MPVDEAELEALSYTYEEGYYGIVHNQDGTLILTARITPRGDQGTAFLQTQVALKVGASYPDEPPDVRLQEAKGLGDSKQELLLSALQKEAEALRGSLMLGHLIETAISWITDHNRPEGSCAFCLEPLTDTSTSILGTGTAAELMRLPCFHSFHVACYCSWWVWQQRNSAAQERDLVQHTGSRAAASVLGDKLPPRELPPYEHLYTTTCPVCRAPAPLAQLTHISGQLEQALHHLPALLSSSSETATIALDMNDVSATTSHEDMTSTVVDVDVKHVRAMQQRNRAAWKRQEAAGGIIGTPPSYSITNAVSRPASGGGGGGGAGQVAAMGGPVAIPPIVGVEQSVDQQQQSTGVMPARQKVNNDEQHTKSQTLQGSKSNHHHIKPGDRGRGGSAGQGTSGGGQDHRHSGRLGSRGPSGKGQARVRGQSVYGLGELSM